MQGNLRCNCQNCTQCLSGMVPTTCISAHPLIARKVLHPPKSLKLLHEARLPKPEGHDPRIIVLQQTQQTCSTNLNPKPVHSRVPHSAVV